MAQAQPSLTLHTYGAAVNYLPAGFCSVNVLLLSIEDLSPEIDQIAANRGWPVFLMHEHLLHMWCCNWFQNLLNVIFSDKVQSFSG